jgi:hypothetical protein
VDSGGLRLAVDRFSSSSTRILCCVGQPGEASRSRSASVASAHLTVADSLLPPDAREVV